MTDTYRTALAGDQLHEDLSRLYRSWQMFDLLGEAVDQLPPEWLRILNIARNLVGGNSPTGVELSPELMTLVTPAQPIFRTVQTPHKRRIVHTPSDDTRVQPLQDLGDFPRITLPDLMLRSLSSEVFEYRMFSGDVNGIYNIEPKPAVEEWEEMVEERVPTGGMTRRRRQRVYVLFDVSNSMNDANKVVFAKALVLAYLLTAAQEHARLYFRAFATKVHPRRDATEPGEFGALARYILDIAPEGLTDMQSAVASAVGDIAVLDEVGHKIEPFETSPTELLLISDCESFLVPHIPRRIRLHTVHLKGGPMAKAYLDGFEEIRAASASFTQIDTTKFVLPSTSRDRWLLMQDGRQISTIASLPAEPGAAHAHGERRRQLLKLYERMENGRGENAVRGKGHGQSGHNQRVPIRVVLQMLADAIARLFRWPWRRSKPEPEPTVSLGMHFRARQ